MPDRVLFLRGDDPTPMGRFRAHSSEVWVAVAGLLVGLALGYAAIDDDFNPSTSIAMAPWHINALVAAFLALGALGWLHATFIWFESPDGYWTRYQLSTGLTGIGWFSYAVVALYSFPSALVPWVCGFMMGGLALTKCRLSWRHQNDVYEAATGHRKSVLPWRD